jgi:DNA-directed RNA polymerase beta subunit
MFLDAFLRELYDEHGIDCGLGAAYDEALDRLCDDLKSGPVARLFSDVWWEKPAESANDVLVRGATYSCVVRYRSACSGTEGDLMRLPYHSGGVFVVDGVQKVIPSVSAFYPTITAATRPVAEENKKADLVVELRKGGLGYKSTAVLTSGMHVRVHINSWRDLARGPASNALARSVDPVTFIGALLENAEVSEVIDMILSKSSDPERIRAYVETIARRNTVLTYDAVRSRLESQLSNCDSAACYRRVREHAEAYVDPGCSAGGDGLRTFAETVAVMVCAALETKAGLRRPVDTEDVAVKRADVFANMIERSVVWHVRTSKLKRVDSIGDVANALRKIGIVVTDKIKKGEVRTFFRNERDFVQALTQKSYLDVLSQVRKIKIPCDSSSADVNVRQSHAGEYGFVCPFETPEGKEVGLLRTFAASCFVTRELSVEDRRTLIEKMRTLEAGDSVLLLDGFYFSTVGDRGVAELREFRSSDPRFKFCSVSREGKIVSVFADRGRMTRPLFDGNGEIAWIDQHEQRSDDVVLGFEANSRRGQTHTEIHGSLMMGIAAGVSPFANHSQASRVAFQSSMSKQAVTCDPAYLAETHDFTSYLWYGQRDIASTSLSRVLNEGARTTGVNCVVLVASMGYNQEDAIVMNKAAVERGLFASTKIRKHRRTFHAGSAVLICGAEGDSLERDEDSVVAEGSVVGRGDVLFTLYRNDTGAKKIDRVLSTDANEYAVARVTKTPFEDDSGSRTSVVIRLERTNTARVGDKFASRYSQKGVIGKLVEPWDLPYAADGTVPDVVVNPHAVPSRMTVGHLMEMAFGRAVCVDPAVRGRAECTAYEVRDVAKFFDLVRGSDAWYNPEDGQEIETNLFSGVCFYQALKHQAVDKFHVRGTGPNAAVSHQPVEGKARGGGLRIGEMERDAFIAYGCGDLITDKFVTNVDKTTIAVCEDCGEMFNGRDECRICESKNLVPVTVPYSFRMVMQNIQAAGITSKARVKRR